MLKRVDCSLYRLTGLVLLCTSLISIIFILRHFVQRYRQRYMVQRRLSFVLISMSISAAVIMTSSIPLVLIQCFTCIPFQSHILVCKMQGFICFANGIFNIYILAFLSVVRYLSVLHKSSSLNHLLEHYHGSSMVFCALIALSWASPPLFGTVNDFVSEGIGLHCSPNWRNSTFRSRTYLISTFFIVYLAPLLLLMYSNLRVSFVLRRLLRSYDDLHSPLCAPRVKRSATATTSSSCSINRTSLPMKVKQSLTIEDFRHTTNRLQRLRIDQRYARMTAIMTAQYLIAWTPYACVGLMIVAGQAELIDRQPVLSAACAIIAKLALILNPLIFIHTNHIQEPRTISACKRLNLPLK